MNPLATWKLTDNGGVVLLGKRWDTATDWISGAIGKQELLAFLNWVRIQIRSSFLKDVARRENEKVRWKILLVSSKVDGGLIYIRE